MCQSNPLECYTKRGPFQVEQRTLHNYNYVKMFIEAFGPSVITIWVKTEGTFLVFFLFTSKQIGSVVSAHLSILMVSRGFERGDYSVSFGSY